MDLSPGRRTEPARPQDGRITLDFVEDIPGFHYSGISPARPHPGCTFVALTHASLKPKMGGIWEQTPLSGGREMFLRGSFAAVLISSACLATSHQPVCPGPAAHGSGRCHARVVVDERGHPKATAVPSGAYGPAQFRGAYKLPSASGGSGQTIGIVDAYDDPNIESDLGVYSRQFALPSCTTANGCFKKVNQTGGT